MAIASLKIFPPIGIARVGNSLDQYFIGPERPLEVVIPSGGFRDASGLLKRQAARFRIFGFGDDGKLIGELTSRDAEIVWSVHLVNKKAAVEWFHPKSQTNPPTRNGGVGDRAQLIFDPQQQQVFGDNPDFVDLKKSKANNKARELSINQLFLDKKVQFSLGTITTDDGGRLVVLGGYGESKSPLNSSLQAGNFANHDGWYDDVSDGRVSATVKLRDGTTLPALDAWVIVAPPKFAPGLHTPVTLYDTLLQSAIERGLTPDPFSRPDFKPSFTRDIFPILNRAAGMRWVYNNDQPKFVPTGFHKSFNAMPPSDRREVFDRLSVPAPRAGDPGTGGGNMPKMWSDAYPEGPNGTLTRTQYKMMEMWKDGNFVDDWSGPPKPASELTPDELTRAALEPCVGAAFFPGIEASWKLRDNFEFVEPFRLRSSSLSPGDVTSQMSLPWQSDFLDCAVESGHFGDDLVWWPAQRPITVLGPTTGDRYNRWARTNSGEMQVEQMIGDWYKLGFVLEAPSGRFEETDRLL